MLTLAIAVGSFFLYLLAYHTYGRWLAQKFYKLDPNAPVPSRELCDGHDFVPTRKQILFGHHFTSIAGTGPIVGPALAVIWGWLPALIWVLFGSIFLGAVHDLSALVVSMRNRGQTIGEIAGRLINPRVKLLFLIILFLALMIVLAIFGLVIANIFDMYPSSVLAVWIAMPIAMVIGYLVYKKGYSPTVPALISLAIMLGCVVLSGEVEAIDFKIPPINLGGYTVGPVVTWTLILLVYCYFASTLPVWLLLQPRDYVNSYLLVFGLALLMLGIGVATFTIDGGVPIVAPAVRADVPGAPPMMPFLFITIACGAISGFHCLVSSGTSSKQIACETDAQFVGYGSMLTEGFLAILVILACCAGLGLGVAQAIPGGVSAQIDGSNVRSSFKRPDGQTIVIARSTESAPDASLFELSFDQTDAGQHTMASSLVQTLTEGETVEIANGVVTIDSRDSLRVSGKAAWSGRYDSWTAAGGLARTISAFVDGSGNFITALGIPKPVAVALMAVLVASFAATTLDTATRLQRYVIQELAQTFHLKPLMGAQGATIFAVVTAAIIAAIPPPKETWATGMGKGGLTLWPVFGAVNQLLAGLSFMVVAFYLARRKMPTWFIAAAAVVMLVLPAGAMLYQLLNTTDGFWPKGQYHLVAAAIIILLLEFWMVAEALKLWPKVQGVLEAELPPLRRGFPVIVESGGSNP
ncbi:hypothetical protein B7486_12565 [cyanobacterium TDX16]|nr:hypothetical protein B7486_12565 [cyanobacterium TDX16]